MGKSTKKRGKKITAKSSGGTAHMSEAVKTRLKKVQAEAAKQFMQTLEDEKQRKQIALLDAAAKRIKALELYDEGVKNHAEVQAQLTQQVKKKRVCWKTMLYAHVATQTGISRKTLNDMIKERTAQ